MEIFAGARRLLYENDLQYTDCIFWKKKILWEKLLHEMDVNIISKIVVTRC